MDDEAKLYQVIGDDCCLTVTIDEDDVCSLVVETEESFSKHRGISLATLLDLLESISQGDYLVGCIDEY